MNCLTCKHCITTSHDITSPGGFNQVSVELYHCELHNISTDEHSDYCDDHTPKEER